MVETRRTTIKHKDKRDKKNPNMVEQLFEEKNSE